MTPARQPLNPDMRYSALERLDIKFTELIGAIEETQVDGQLSSKNHGDYELVCYCRGFIRAELEKERRATHTSPPAPAPDKPKFSSEDLLLLAHDEWKRREERKHNHNEQDWIAGFLNGFCTSHKWAREQVDKIRADTKHPSTKGGAR
ncbi:MAG: hypothetical protein WC356_05600 [Candidatus Micrarchaeia archaeon]|jgi:hypothetical protein